MFGSVRRGHLLLRNLQRCALRAPTSTTLATRQLKQFPRVSLLTARTFHVSPTLRNVVADARAPAPEEEQAKDGGLITEFAELGDKGYVSQKVIGSITNMGIKTMTEVQSRTINETLNNTDMLAQAKTGTGKTLAFLIPVIQNILKDENLLKRYNTPRSSAADIRSVIISPTRELAEQIAVEAKKIVRATGIVVQTAVGGTRKREGLKRIQKEGCHILVGTPGRLIDIFSDPTSGVSAPKLSSFVLDEADRLLDIGFAQDIEQMQSFFPERSQVDRQTLMFSATIPREVKSLVRNIMKPNFSYVNTIGEETPTHLKVPQKAVFLRGFENQLPALFELSKRAMLDHINDPVKHTPFKAIVYFNTTAEVVLARMAFASLRKELDMLNPEGSSNVQIIEMHSRLTQAQRTFSSDVFRRLNSGILFSSDVTSRGMDFPNVTHVIQIGVAVNKESYIHRLGRTARADKTGEGWVFLTDPEFPVFRNKLGSLPIDEDTSLQMPTVNLSNPSQVPEFMAAPYAQLCRTFESLPPHMMASVYGIIRAQLGRDRRVDKREVDRMLSQLCTSIWGMDAPPQVADQNQMRDNRYGLPESRNNRSSNFDSTQYGSRNYGSNPRPINNHFSRDRSGGRGQMRDSGFDRSGEAFERPHLTRKYERSGGAMSRFKEDFPKPKRSPWMGRGRQSNPRY